MINYVSFEWQTREKRHLFQVNILHRYAELYLFLCYFVLYYSIMKTCGHFSINAQQCRCLTVPRMHVDALAIDLNGQPSRNVMYMHTCVTHLRTYPNGLLPKLLSMPKRSVRRRRQAPFRDAHGVNLIRIIIVALY